jgi:hypothetical protein
MNVTVLRIGQLVRLLCGRLCLIGIPVLQVTLLARLVYSVPGIGKCHRVLCVNGFNRNRGGSASNRAEA